MIITITTFLHLPYYVHKCILNLTTVMFESSISSLKQIMCLNHLIIILIIIIDILISIITQ